MTDNPLHRKKEKYIYDRSTTISPLYVGMRVNIYSGRKFFTKFINR
jgi:ribosomal protein S19